MKILATNYGQAGFCLPRASVSARAICLRCYAPKLALWEQRMIYSEFVEAFFVSMEKK